MDDSASHGQSFSMPSPGEILKQKARRSNKPETGTGIATDADDITIASNPFRGNQMSQALIERRVMLAPLLVQWNYHVSAVKPFAKWLRTRELILSDARLAINDDTAGAHYFGTYIAQTHHQTTSDAASDNVGQETACQTLWGFSNEGAMTHMFDLCRGKIERISIVETDLRDFVTGLKAHIRTAGVQHFSQSVFVSPAAM
jgi:hypothetical protein